jgi:uncharacterized membrane protein
MSEILGTNITVESIKDIKKYLIVLCLVILIDLPMILLINRNMYSTQLKRVNVEDTSFSFLNIITAAITYSIVAFSIYYFIILDVNLSNYEYKDILIKSSILGFVIYSIYNGTNKSTLNKWGMYESLIDTLWGTVLYSIISISTIYIISNKLI